VFQGVLPDIGPHLQIRRFLQLSQQLLDMSSGLFPDAPQDLPELLGPAELSEMLDLILTMRDMRAGLLLLAPHLPAVFARVSDLPALLPLFQLPGRVLPAANSELGLRGMSALQQRLPVLPGRTPKVRVLYFGQGSDRVQLHNESEHNLPAHLTASDHLGG
jgi:hypothetical protein